MSRFFFIRKNVYFAYALSLIAPFFVLQSDNLRYSCWNKKKARAELGVE